jgi:hypothetical protein
MGVEIQLFEVIFKKPYKRYEGKTNELLIAFIGYVKDLNKLQQFKVSVFCNANDQFISCAYFFFVDFAFHPSPQTKI